MPAKPIYLYFETPFLNSNGEAYKNATQENLDKLKIKTNEELDKNIDKLPPLTFSHTFDKLFDLLPIPSNSLFALYSGTLVDIRTAKKAKKTFIELSEDDVKKLQSLFSAPIEDKPEQNRSIAFIFNTLKGLLAQ